MQSSTISNEAEPCGSSPSPSGPSASSNPPLCSRCHHDENKGGDGGKMMLTAELSKGRDSTYKMLRLLRQHQAADDNDSAPSLETLAKEIEYSICTCISLVNTTTSTTPDTPAAIRDPIDQRHETVKLEDSGQSSLAPAATKGRRGCYKKRRINCETTWIKDSPNQMADEHAWRKYGQKAILNATHPRSYYRCTHKMDQGCQASKQVQQISSNPTLYRTTYTGYHTCNTTQDQAFFVSLPNAFDRPDSSLDKQKSAESSVFINFESNTGPKEHDTLKDDLSSGLEFLQTDDDKQYYSPTVSNYLTLLESTALLEQQEPSSSGQLTAAGLSSIAGGSSSASAAGSGSGSGSWSGSDHGDVIWMVPRPVSAGLDDMDQIIAGFDVSHDQLDETDWLEDEGCASW
ncbi:hypothetical protein Droror1_Dr00026441 [Drosera rotundifolia]